MRSPRDCLFPFLLAIHLAAFAQAASPTAPYGLNGRIPFTSGRVVGTPEPPPPYRLVRAWPKLTFSNPVHVVNDADSDRLLVLEYHGKVWAVDPSSRTDHRDLFLDLPRDLYSLTFHPNYATNGFVYVFSHTSNDKLPRNIISRFRVTDERPRRVDPRSELVIIDWESNGHDGGDLAFGPKDGFLYLSAGDSTTSSDPKETGQDLSDLLSAVLRIDVDHPDPGKSYAIPIDNPFRETPRARAEIWAYGFRNPWRFCFDPANGRLWMGDIGQDLWEMIEIVERGSNHGWSVKEGPADFLPERPKRGPTPIKPPVVAHPHVEARSITGGLVYRSARWPDLTGAYFYGDFSTGRIWALRYDDGQVTDHREIADSSVAMLGLCVDRRGEIITADYTSGGLYRLERQPKTSQSDNAFPRRLSDTGLFASTRDYELAPGVIPFAVNSPLWSDGARKERAFALPGNGKIEFSPSLDSPWTLPEGTVLLKSFCLPIDDRGHCEIRVETRLLVRRDGEWEGYSYLWNDDQSDAVLVGKNGLDKSYTRADRTSPGGKATQVWHFPSRAECMVCHTRAAGYVLGISTGQLNRDYDYAGTIDNQIRTYDHLGLFSEPLPKRPEELSKLPAPHNPDYPIEVRARSYLHTNCAICHVESGGGNARFQLRFTLPETELNLFDQTPQHHSFGLKDAKLIAPGHPERSVLLHRVSTRGEGKMPPLASTVVDEKGVKLLKDWIAIKNKSK
jgi:uncharacterized repeat protein (TIGR03806 family)